MTSTKFMSKTLKLAFFGGETKQIFLHWSDNFVFLTSFSSRETLIKFY